MAFHVCTTLAVGHCFDWAAINVEAREKTDLIDERT